MIGFAALAADLPHLYQNQQHLQTIADAAAHASAMALPDVAKVEEPALALAAANTPAGYGPITTQSDVILGVYKR